MNTDYREILRRLTLNDEQLLSNMMGPSAEPWLGSHRRLMTLEKLAALAALRAEATTFQALTDHARVAGLEASDLEEAIDAIASIIGPDATKHARRQLSTAWGSESD